MGAKDLDMPKTWNHLVPLGTMWTNFRNEGITLTNPGHSSIETGTWQDLDNEGKLRPYMPTMFEYFRKETGADEQSTAVIVGKSKLNILTYSTYKEYGEKYKAAVYIGSNDNEVFSLINSVLFTKHPRLVIINFPSVDLAGHTGKWDNYIAALKNVDSLVYEIWQELQSDKFYYGNTTVFITNDHGRHDDAHGGFQEHGDGCEGCRHIMLLALGKGFPAGRVVNKTRTQCDILPTIGSLLSFSTPNAIGNNLLEDTTDSTLSK
jgi:phosphopentomutase